MYMSNGENERQYTKVTWAVIKKKKILQKSFHLSIHIRKKKIKL